jgi:hypothetical protein
MVYEILRGDDGTPVEGGDPAGERVDEAVQFVLRGLSGLVDGEHYFDTIADSAIFESRYHFPGWPLTIRGRAKLTGYGKTISTLELLPLSA